MQYSNYKNPNKKLSGWSTSTITNILKDRTYIGDLVQHKYSSVNYKIKKVVKLEECEYIIVSNNHSKIIEKSDYYKVQQMLKNKANECKRNSAKLHILTGIAFCNKCGSRIAYTKNHSENYKIICSNYKKNGAKACENIYLEEIDIIDIVKNQIMKNIIKKNIKTIEMGYSRKYEISKIENEICKNKHAIAKIYEDRIENIIDDTIAKELILQYTRENKLKEKELIKLQQNQNKTVDIIKAINTANSEELRSLILKLISKISISKNKITIYYNYS